MKSKDAPPVSTVFYRPENYSPEESIGYMMRRTINLISSEIDRQMEPQGLTNAQWVPLLKLYMGQASTVAELARNCQVDAGAMTRTLDRLEAKDLVRRARSSGDRRVVNIEITPAGRKAAQGIPAILCDIQNSYLEGFSVEEWQLLKGLMRRVLANAQARSNPAPAP